MGENCDQNCKTCSQNCDQRKEDKVGLLKEPHSMSHIKKVVGIVSGKGGVGKSIVTSMLAVLMRRQGYNTAILDADITGPSIPKAFGIDEKAKGNEYGLLPVKSNTGISVMSINLLLGNSTDPVVWRGPLIGSTVKQFWTDVVWGDVDYMFIDMPPGTGDVPLTVFQSVPVDGIIVVTSPQELVSMIVSKAANMAKKMNIPIIGLIENMAYLKCPDCGSEIKVFGDSHIDDIAIEYKLDVLARIPIDPALASACDEGKIENYSGDWLDGVVKHLEIMEG